MHQLRPRCWPFARRPRSTASLLTSRAQSCYVWHPLRYIPQSPRVCSTCMLIRARRPTGPAYICDLTWWQRSPPSWRYTYGAAHAAAKRGRGCTRDRAAQQHFGPVARGDDRSGPRQLVWQRRLHCAGRTSSHHHQVLVIFTFSNRGIPV